jgi:hypothetical protein
MDKKIPSLNDLSITIHLINKKYKIKEFIEEYRSRISEVNETLRKELVTVDGLTNPVQKVIQISQDLTNEELDETVEIVEKLSSKYNYENYLEECETARKAFINERNDYFAIKATKSQAKIVDEITTLFELAGASELMFSRWIDTLIEKISPKTLEIEYEDLDGKRKKMVVKHRVTSMADEYVEAPLIDRYHGINAYDAFLLHSFFDVQKNRWSYVPVRLIISIKADEEIEDLSGIDDEK